MGLSNFAGTPSPGTAVPPQAGAQNDPAQYLINYNRRFATSQPVLFRDDVTAQLVSVLIGKDKPNALLIGPAGCGKTRIVEDLARRIETKDPSLPQSLHGHTIYELPLSAVISGAVYRGEMEERIRSIVEFIQDPNNRAILFIDEIHMLSGRSSDYKAIAQFLKPALARGDIRCIGATTTQEKKDLTDDPALMRRFSIVLVDELTREQTVEILKNVRGSYILHYQNTAAIDETALPMLVDIADEYRPAGSHRPDNALTLLDRAMGDAVVARKRMEEEASRTGNQAMLSALQASPFIPVTEKQIRRTAFRLMTGNAVQPEYDETAMKNALSVIKGQDRPISEILRLLKRDSLNLYPKTKPTAVLLAGASGVGKTEVTKIIARTLTGTVPIILNMTEYHSPASINRIIGSPPGYVGSDSNAELPFDALESNPYQFILLDEFEKADPAVQRLFMSALEEGKIRTNRGGELDFSRATIVATTNAGHTDRSASIGFGNKKGPETVRQTAQTLSKCFDMALLNRFTKILTFNDISEDTYKEIVADKYRKEVSRILSIHPRMKLKPELDDDELNEITKQTYVPQFGARPAEKAVMDCIENQVL